MEAATAEQIDNMSHMGTALALSFGVNAVFVWDGIYERVVKMQKALSVDAEAVDRIMAVENIEQIAMASLNSTVGKGEKVNSMG